MNHSADYFSELMVKEKKIVLILSDMNSTGEDGIRSLASEVEGILCHQEKCVVEFNFDGVKAMSSKKIGLVVSCIRKLSANGFCIKIFDAPEIIQDVINVTHLTDVIVC